MRHALVLMTAFILGGIGFSAAPASAAPVPAPAATAFGPSHATVETVGYWRRYCKFNDCTGNANVDLDVTAPVVVTENPPIIAIVPVRPASCGQYRYWDGAQCVDARYNNPYIGPR